MTRAAPAALRHQSAARILARERRNRRETRRQGPARSRRHSATARPRLPLPAPRPRRGPASPAAAGAAGWAAGTGGAARAGDGASGRPRGAGGRGSGSAGSDRPPCHSAASGHGAERSPRRSSRSLRLPPARPCLPSPPPLCSPPFPVAAGPRTCSHSGLPGSPRGLSRASPAALCPPPASFLQNGTRGMSYWLRSESHADAGPIYVRERGQLHVVSPAAGGVRNARPLRLFSGGFSVELCLNGEDDRARRPRTDHFIFTYTKEGNLRYSAKSLFSLVLGYISDNVDHVDSLVGFPEQIAEKLFSAAEARQKFTEPVTGLRALQKFTEAYGSLVLCSLCLRNRYVHSVTHQHLLSFLLACFKFSYFLSTTNLFSRATWCHLILSLALSNTACFLLYHSFQVPP